MCISFIRFYISPVQLGEKMPYKYKESRKKFFTQKRQNHLPKVTFSWNIPIVGEL